MSLHVKKLVTLLMLLGSHVGFSGTMGADKTAETYNGVYVGANIGASDLQDKAIHYYSPETHHLGGIGIVGGGLLGYDVAVTDKVRVGIEGFAQAAGLNSSIQHYDQTTGVQDNSEEINSRYNLGVRVLPGYQFTEATEGHFILGYANAHFKQFDNGTYGYIDTDFNQSGLQGGLGWKSNIINPHAFMRFDVLYTRYSGQVSTGTGLSGSGSPYQYYSDNFSTLEADLTFIYKFN